MNYTYSKVIKISKYGLNNDKSIYLKKIFPKLQSTIIKDDQLVKKIF